MQEIPHELFAVGRQDGFGMELDALDGVLLVAHAHDRAVFQFGGDGEASGQRFSLDDERMVAADFQVLGQPRVKPLSIVADGRRLAVHDLLGTHDAH